MRGGGIRVLRTIIARRAGFCFGVRRAVEALTPEERAKAEEIKNGIDLMDSQTAILYGVGAQRNLAEFSDNILANVRNKDTGYVGDLMGELVEKVRDVGVDEAEGGVLDKLPFLRSAARAVSTTPGEKTRLSA